MHEVDGELFEFLIFGLSLVALYSGAKSVTFSATYIAKFLGLSEFVIGATIVAFGTSLPELASSILAMLTDTGYPGIVVGNVVGSNIANIGLAIGLSGIFYHVYIDRKLIETDIPFLIASALAFLVAFLDLMVTWIEGVILISMYLVFTYQELSERPKNEILLKETFDKKYLLIFIGGLVLLYLGARYLIITVLEVAVIIGISEAVVAFILVAIGTSIPEVVTSAVAAKEGRGDIAVGNVVGSNTFNSLIVLGVSTLFGRVVVDASFLYPALLSMILFSLLLGFMLIDNRISRLEGTLLFLIYLVVLLNIF